MNYDARKLFFAGFIATVVQTAFLYCASLFRLPSVDVAGALGMMMTPSSFPLYPHPSWMMGLAIHFFLGSLFFPLCYGLLLGGRLKLQRPAMCGLAWGLILYCAGQFIVMPLLGMTEYFLTHPYAIAMYLAGHIAYGLLFGAIAGISMFANFIPRTRARHRRLVKPDLAAVR
ncbi:MAG: hypothetical protein K2X77_29945 [Candidatus Obscuribacterales bacterium]|nr:hypothetical protein [Candidatus Obscuribacterales bacterium]